MSNQKIVAGETPKLKDMKKQVRNAQANLLQEKINALLSQVPNDTLPMGKRDGLVNEALWLLKNVPSVIDSDSNSGSSQVDYNIPQPNAVRFKTTIPLSLPDGSLTKDAFGVTDTETLFLRLEMISQMALDSMRGPPLNADGTVATLDDTTTPVMAQLDSWRSDVRETHYSIVAVGLHLHYYLSWLFDQWGAAKFLDAMQQVEMLLLSYDAFAPDFAIQFEENALRSIRVVTGVTHDVWTYLTSPAFLQLQQKKQALAASPAAPVAAAPPAAAAPPPVVPPSLIPTPVATPAPVTPATPLTLAAPMTPAAGVPPASTVSPEAAQPVPAATVSLVKSRKGKKTVVAARVAKVSRVEGRTASVFQVSPANSVTVDLDPSLAPTDVVSNIEQLFTTYIAQGLDTIAQMKAAAAPVNFNIYTNMFGSAASLTDNVSELEGIRANIIKYIADQFRPTTTLDPTIFVVFNMVTKFFAGALGPGDPVSTLNLLPGETVEKRMQTSTSDSTTKTQQNSVVDSSSQAATQSLQNTIQNTQTQEHDTSSDQQSYDNTNTTSNTHHLQQTQGLGAAGTGMGQAGGAAQGVAGAVSTVAKAVGSVVSNIPVIGGLLGGIANLVGGIAGGAASAPSGAGAAIGSAVGGVVNTLQNVGIVKGGPTQNITDETTNNTANDSGTSSAINDTVNSGSTAMQQAVSSNTQQTNQSRQVSVSDSTTTTTESTQENSETRTFKNPNCSSSLTIIFYNVLRRYTGVTLVEDVKIMFSNGTFADGAAVNEIDTILNKFVRPECTAVMANVRHFVSLALNIKDWQDRVVNVADPGAPYLCVKMDPYFDMLQASGSYVPAPGDALIQQHNDDLVGVVKGVTNYSMIVPGIFADTDVGHVALDANEQKLFTVDYERRQIDNEQAKADLEGAQIANKQAQKRVDILGDIQDFAKATTDEDTRLKIYFELTKDDRNIFDKTELLRFLSNKGGYHGPRTEI
jgi:hypothetical protein